jgi:hypothetical protein
MRFPITDLLDETECLKSNEKHLRPSGFACPDCGSQSVSHRASPKLDWRCTKRRRIFIVFTGTIFKGIHHSTRQLVLIIRGLGYTAIKPMLRRRRRTRFEPTQRPSPWSVLAILTTPRKGWPCTADPSASALCHPRLHLNRKLVESKKQPLCSTKNTR